MKCYEIRSFGLDGLQAGERPDPEPGPGEVLVRMRAASLNYRDLMMVQGMYNPKLPMPRVPLSDGAGEVEAVGPGVEDVSVGQRVASCFFQEWTSGGVGPWAARSALGGEVDGVLAERVVLRADGVVPVPEHLSFEEAATLPCAAVTAWQALTVGGHTPGEGVLTLGSGGVSVFALQLAAAAGARVIVTSKSDEKLARLRELGAAHGINYRTQPDWEKDVLAATDGSGVDRVVEVGGAGTMPRSLKAVRIGGTVALIGVLAGAQGEFNPLLGLMKAVRIQGIFVGSRAMFQDLNRFVALHELRPVVDQVFPVDDVVAALQRMERGEHLGKIVLRFE